MALAFALAGIEVTFYGRREDSVNACLKNIELSLATRQRLGLIDEEQVNAVLSRIKSTTDLTEAVQDADLVIESIAENKTDKANLFAQIYQICRPGTIFATNTSSLQILEIADLASEMLIESGKMAPAEAADFKARIVAAHFFYPADFMPGVEVVCSQYTSGNTAQRTLELMQRCGKEAVLLAKETNGFVVNLIQASIGYAAFNLLERHKPELIDRTISRANIFEAVTNPEIGHKTKSPILKATYEALELAVQALLDAGVTDRKGIKQLVDATLAPRYRVTGPLKTMDMAGLDIFAKIMTNCAKLLGKTELPRLLREYISDSKFGPKTLSKMLATASGVYSWTVRRLRVAQSGRMAELAKHPSNMAIAAKQRMPAFG